MGSFEKMLRQLSPGELRAAAEGLLERLYQGGGEGGRLFADGAADGGSNAKASVYGAFGEELGLPGAEPAYTERRGLGGRTLSRAGEDLLPTGIAESSPGEEAGAGTLLVPTSGHGAPEPYPGETWPAVAESSARAEAERAEALSEYFRRDSRRYDRGFERY